MLWVVTVALDYYSFHLQVTLSWQQYTWLNLQLEFLSLCFYEHAHKMRKVSPGCVLNWDFGFYAYGGYGCRTVHHPTVNKIATGKTTPSPGISSPAVGVFIYLIHHQRVDLRTNGGPQTIYMMERACVSICYSLRWITAHRRAYIIYTQYTRERTHTPHIHTHQTPHTYSLDGRRLKVSADGRLVTVTGGDRINCPRSRWRAPLVGGGVRWWIVPPLRWLQSLCWCTGSGWEPRMRKFTYQPPADENMVAKSSFFEGLE